MSLEARVEILEGGVEDLKSIQAGLKGAMELFINKVDRLELELKKEMAEFKLEIHERLDRMNSHQNKRLDKLEVLLTTILTQTKPS
ncbi:hypothetical protein [Endozoicomonas sp. Mp262]|uniref:hypothetical protein n=1 Tax=Endozoicomonas sp. Mp262 TaxID=2919499 RepID=UPI0021DB7517